MQEKWTIFPAPDSNQRADKKIPERIKQPLKPGHSPLDWAMLKQKHSGPKGFAYLTMEDVAKHASETDAWMIIQGRVYDVTEYMDFHPGGRKKLMLAAGKDGTVLYSKPN